MNCCDWSSTIVRALQLRVEMGSPSAEKVAVLTEYEQTGSCG